jgi:hypothetical protein
MINIDTLGNAIFSGAGGTFEVGSKLQVVAPLTADATLVDLGLTLLFQRP